MVHNNANINSWHVFLEHRIAFWLCTPTSTAWCSG